MNKAHKIHDWKNFPSTETPIDEDALNELDVSVDVIDDRVIVLDTTKAEKIEMSELFCAISYDDQTGVITLTRVNGATVAIDTPMEKIALNIYYDPVTEMLALPLVDGTQIQVNLSRLITEYEFLDSDTIAFSVGVDGKVTAIVKEGSIQEKHLRPDYLADIKVEARKAQASAESAAQSESAASSSAGAAKASEDNAAESAERAEVASQSATTASTSASESATSAAESAESAGGSAADASESARQAAESAERAEEIAGGQFIPITEKGAAGGVATLDNGGKIPKTQLPEDVGAVTSVNGMDGDVNLSKSDVGLGNVANERQYSAQNPQPSVAGSSGSCTGNAATASDADMLDGHHGSSGRDAGTYVLRDGNNYVHLNYVNSNTVNNENPAVSQVIVTNGSDDYYRKASLTHLKSQMALNNVDNTPDSSKSVAYANSAGTATVAAKLGRDANAAAPMTFNWSGQGGQPSWLWGGNDGSNMYVYNPSNFNVSYASGAGNADTLDGNHATAFLSASEKDASISGTLANQIASLSSASSGKDFSKHDSGYISVNQEVILYFSRGVYHVYATSSMGALPVDGNISKEFILDCSDDTPQFFLISSHGDANYIRQETGTNRQIVFTTNSSYSKWRLVVLWCKEGE